MEGRTHRMRQKNFRIMGRVTEIPEGSIAVTVYIEGANVLIDGMGQRTPEHAGDKMVCFDHYIRTQQFGDDEFFLDAIRTNKLLLMSDGSAKDGQGAAAWLLTSEEFFTRGLLIKGSVKIPGSHIDSYRAECFGIYGVSLDDYPTITTLIN
jgi:hypothetical protein